jgi:hypothetical protein
MGGAPEDKGHGILEGTFEKGQKVSDAQVKQLNIEHHIVCSQWNYTIRPHLAVLSEI